MRPLLYVCILASVAGMAHAQTSLPAGTVACQTVQDIKNYQQYSQTAPEFAQDLLARAIKMGVKDFVVKPFPPERLQQAAQKALS